ncbi:aspartate aminotransferase family protein [Bacillus salipaludis]|uniref:Aspartate aminotransferase family protein n=1 Tax=Bacillus salipaludis TaxID=2547811 RepID=A0A4R5VSM9_9BACI|nr:aspartate aminotransferase family protein [Bacillus salipaludis]MDQ6598553.1 aspartate aminotransferase family protein [Bacillus salipaludis]TDK60891.1 aspartate aminotransferase family protein [Bacillus salipaludis]
MRNLDSELLRTEGDINLSQNRKEWQERHLSEQAFQLLEEDSEFYLHQSLSTPCLNVIEKSYGIYLEDIDGRKYMDFHGNSVHQVGYGNQYVIKAVKDQLDVLPFSPRRYTNNTAIQLARKLVELAPGHLNKVLLAPGGASAVSMALKLVRKATGKFKTISMWDSFHGASLDAISVGGEAIFRNGMGPLMPGTLQVMPYNSYRCFFGDRNASNEKGLDYLEYVMEREGDIGAIILEPIRCTDVQIPPKEYHQRLRQICDTHGVLLIYDEIPTALGRTGEMFAFENYGVLPDIVLLGKGLGGGVFPMAAMLAREDLDVAGDIALGHFTHEKSSLGCAAALATLQYIEDFRLLERANSLGEYMKTRLLAMQNRFELIGDVRGIGLLYGVELVLNRKTKAKAVSEAERIMYKCMEKGLSFKVSQGNVLTLAPPLTITEKELELAMDILEKSF